jgi:HD-GYP domain-containing protein (c-di-GMP phosphodiesterase class II)
MASCRVKPALASPAAHRENSLFGRVSKPLRSGTVEGGSHLQAAANGAPRLVEVVAAFSLATDLGLGQPMEHGLRSCLIASRLAEKLDLDEEARACIFWVALLAMVGCTATSQEMSALFGDDIELRRGLYDVGPSQMAMPRYYLARAGSGGGPLRRARAGASLMRSGMRAVMQAYMADCEITGSFAGRLGLGEAVSEPLQQKFARWDGKGIPNDVAGEQIPLAARLLAMSWRLEAEHRQRGIEAALALLNRHAGTTLDPQLVSQLGPTVPEVLAGLEEECWQAVVAAEPPRARLGGEALEAALEALGDFADLKSPWFSGHSRAVAELAEAAGWRLALPESDVTRLRHAALVHSLGRSGVPNTIWDKRGTLTASERERMQLYPYLTDRVLRRGSLAQLADTSSASQERLDGSGYPRGLSGSAIPMPARLLAAADLYQALCEPRPHRPAIAPKDAAEQLRGEARDGRIDAEAAEAVLAASGHRAERQRAAPADLTAREIEVLRLIARGRTSAETARELDISAKTVSTHVEHIYAKIGATNRSVATLFAMQHGLL